MRWRWMLAALWCFCDGIGVLLEAGFGDQVWFGDSLVLNASRFLFVPVPRGSV